MTAALKLRNITTGGAWSLQADAGFDCANGDVIEAQLEDSPALDVRTLTVSIVVASKDAEDLTFPGPSTTGYSPSPPTAAFQFTAPATGAHSWYLRSQTNNGEAIVTNGVSDNGAANTKERIISIRTPNAALRKGVIAETGQYDPIYGWMGAQNEMVDAVDAALGSIASTWKDAAKAVATGNIALTGIPAAQDGVTIGSGDMLLLTAQTAPAENWLWNVSAGAWTRALDSDSSAEVRPGATVRIWAGGTTYGKSVWQVANTSAITLGVTGITVVEVEGGIGTAVAAPAVNTGTAMRPIIGVSPATGIAPGSQSAVHFALLTAATASATGGTLDLRGASGESYFGFIGVGAGPLSGVGLLRLPTIASLYARNNANSADLRAFAKDASDNFDFADTTTPITTVHAAASTGLVRVAFGATTVVEIQPTKFRLLGTAQQFLFGSLVAIPGILQEEPAADVDGSDMYFTTQAGGAGNAFSGDMLLRSGAFTGSERPGSIRINLNGSIAGSQFEVASLAGMTRRIIAVHLQAKATTTNVPDGDMVMIIGNAGVEPTTAPVGGPELYGDAGGLGALSTAGLKTTMAPLGGTSTATSKWTGLHAPDIAVTDASVTGLTPVITLPDNCVMQVGFHVIARRPSTGDSAGFFGICTIYRHGGGGATIVGSGAAFSVNLTAGAATWLGACAVSGNTVFPTFRGQVGADVWAMGRMDVLSFVKT